MSTLAMRCFSAMGIYLEPVHGANVRDAITEACKLAKDAKQFVAFRINNAFFVCKPDSNPETVFNNYLSTRRGGKR